MPVPDHQHALPSVLQPPPPPLDGFSADEFRARRAALRQAFPHAIVVVQGEKGAIGSFPLPWRQNSTFFYLTGVDVPDAALVLLPENLMANTGARDLKPTDREILFLPARSASLETWNGPRLGPGSETEQLTGIEAARDALGFIPALSGWMRRCPRIALPAPWGEQAAVSRELALMRKLQEMAPVAQFEDIAPQVANLRIVKSEAEQERLALASRITCLAHSEARSALMNGTVQHEHEVEAIIQSVFYKNRSAAAFAPIVGGGRNAAVLHYDANNAPLQQGDAVVIDIGALTGHYCGDVTRTYPVGLAFSPRQAEIYNTVLNAHRFVVERFETGKTSLQDMTERCKEFYRSAPARALAPDGTEQTMDFFMPHGISHHLGLDVHDVHANADWSAPLHPGSVITVEPGIYLPGESIGVRLENDYVVTPSGLRRLADDLPASAGEV